ncbi:DoxX family membrane protein [Desulfobotulus sp. H1]|uniref:DoxX family membrane protein n=1 Tax=Desulfobotulus pelophilus TaxID=2823377 RepID=A0ABT3NC40_9BACT|nr:MauE/DoxX family redox-associated membrane protein [Desulfobotulus pelophilus]MCW7755033.1 DoxX family membrane protein [Desulfobotulus pelophilus]
MPHESSREQAFPWEHLALAGRLAMAVIFLAAGIPKIFNPHGFAQIIELYQILPAFLIQPVALILPWLEVILAILLVTQRAYPAAVVLTNLLLISFVAGLLFNMYRGLDISCGCFSTDPEATGDAFFYLLRDASFLLLSFYLLVHLVRKQP